MVKNLPANAGDAGLILGSRRSPGVGTGNPLSILAWKIPWTEKPVGYSLWGLKESDTTEHIHTHTAWNRKKQFFEKEKCGDHKVKRKSYESSG